MKSNCNYKIDHGSIGVASRGILSAGPFQKSFTAGDDAQGCCGGRGRGQNSRERRTALASKNFGLEHWIADFLNFWMDSVAWMKSKGQV